MHLKRFQTTQLFMLFLSKVARSQSSDVLFRFSNQITCSIFFMFHYILLYFAIFCYVLLYFIIFYYILLYFTIFYYSLLYFTIFYYILLYFTIFC